MLLYLMSWIQYQGPVRWALFAGTFLAVGVWETFRPLRLLDWPAERRWGSHALLLAVSAVVETVMLRVGAVAVAVMVASSRYGILNRPWWPFILRCAAAIVLLDLVRYGTHRAFHSVSFLWRIHEVHHSDPDYDVSTAARFHPLEVVLTQAAFLAAIAMLAPPPAAVFASELISTVLNLFVHANASLPDRVERLLRRAIVTPDLHRIHHSEEIEEQSTNFGQTFCWWDRLFGTWLAGTQGGKLRMITGIKGLRNATSLKLGFMLREPFRRRRTDGSA